VLCLKFYAGWVHGFGIQVALHSDLLLLYAPAQLALAALLLNQARRHFQQQLDAGEAQPAVDLTQT
jgi:hypothetical protein